MVIVDLFDFSPSCCLDSTTPSRKQTPSLGQ